MTVWFCGFEGQQIILFNAIQCTHTHKETHTHTNIHIHTNTHSTCGACRRQLAHGVHRIANIFLNYCYNIQMNNRVCREVQVCVSWPKSLFKQALSPNSSVLI